MSFEILNLSERHRRISCHRPSAPRGAWHPRRGQPLPPPQRHPPIADPGGLSHSQNYLPPRFRADRAHHTHGPTHGVVATAAGWHVHRPQSQALRDADRHGIQRRRFNPALDCARVLGDLVCSRPGGRRVRGVPSGSVAHRPHGFRRPARAGAVAVFGRWECRILHGSAAGGIYRAAQRTAQHRVVLIGGHTRHGAAGVGQCMVQSAQHGCDRATNWHAERLPARPAGEWDLP